jgi:hypothetical protein
VRMCSGLSLNSCPISQISFISCYVFYSVGKRTDVSGMQSKVPLVLPVQLGCLLVVYES